MAAPPAPSLHPWGGRGSPCPPTVSTFRAAGSAWKGDHEHRPQAPPSISGRFRVHALDRGEREMSRMLVSRESTSADNRPGASAMPPAINEESVSEAATDAKRILVEEARRAVAVICGRAPRALILTGSFARGEATVLRRADGL